MVTFQILARQDFSPWSKYAEDNEVWGAQALAAMANKPALYSDKYDSDPGVVSRLRAISLASSVPDQYAAKVRRQLSISAKLSSSAPYQQGALQQKDDRGNAMALQTGAEAASSASGLFSSLTYPVLCIDVLNPRTHSLQRDSKGYGTKLRQRD